MAHGRLVRTEIARLGLSKVVSFATRAANNISTTLSSLHPSRKIFHGRVSSAAPAPLNSATPNNFLQRPSFQPAETAPNSRLGSSLDKSTDNSLKCLGNQLNKLKRLHYESIEISDHISILKQEIASNEELLLKLSENKDSSADQSFLEELGIDKDRLADFKHYGFIVLLKETENLGVQLSVFENKQSKLQKDLSKTVDSYKENLTYIVRETVLPEAVLRDLLLNLDTLNSRGATSIEESEATTTTVSSPIISTQDRKKNNPITTWLKFSMLVDQKNAAAPVVVLKVNPGGLAEKNGLKVNDVITSFNEVKILDQKQFMEAIRGYSDPSATLVITRNDKQEAYFFKE